jgi:hypothetical protein
MRRKRSGDHASACRCHFDFVVAAPAASCKRMRGDISRTRPGALQMSQVRLQLADAYLL